MTKSHLVLGIVILVSVGFAATLEGQRPTNAPDQISVVGRIDNRGPLTWGPAPAGPAHAPRERTFHVQHQTVSVSFDWARRAVIGSTTLRVAALDKLLDQVRLDAVGMTIGDVTDASGRALPHEYDGRSLLVRLGTPLRPGDSTTIIVHYEAVHPRAGVYFVERRHVVWTQGRLEDNRYWVPMYDYPNDKTTWDLFITSSANERAFATGTLVGQRAVGGGTEWHWAQPTPAPTYFMTVVVGPYASVADSLGSLTLHYWGYRDSLTSTASGFAPTPRIIDFLTRKLGVPFPSRSFDQAVVPDFIFWDALESWRPLIPAVVQDDRLILERRVGWPGEDRDAAIARAVAQEWFGKLVTPADWSHLWLSDGIANYLAVDYAEEGRARDSTSDDAQWSQVSNFASDRDARRPLVYNHWQYGPIELLLTEHVTQKSVVVLRLLRAQLGDSAFWSGMRRYLTEHANGTATTADFERAMEQASGRDLRVFFREWVYGAGFPFLKVSFTTDTAAQRVTFTVQQVQKRDSITGFFDADVDVEVLTDAGAERARMPLHGERSTFAMSVHGVPRAVRWDPDRRLPSDVELDRPLPTMVYQLEHDASASGRAEAVRGIGERVMGTPGVYVVTPGNAPRSGHPELIPALVRTASTDPSMQVREAAITMLAPLRMFDDSITSALLRLSYDKAPTVRMLAVMGLNGFPDERITARLTEMANGDPDSTVRFAVQEVQSMLDRFGGFSQANVDRYSRAKAKLADPATPDEEKASLMQTVSSPEVPGGWNIAKQYLVDPKSGRMLREAAMRALGIATFMREAVPGPDPTMVVDLLAPFLDSDDPSLRLSAARELGQVKIEASKGVLEARKAREVDARVLYEIDQSLTSIKRGDPARTR